jgi:hypothetical protein
VDSRTPVEYDEIPARNVPLDSLSAFVGAGLVFAGITDCCGMRLLLAKLPWNTHKPA